MLVIAFVFSTLKVKKKLHFFSLWLCWFIYHLFLYDGQMERCCQSFLQQKLLCGPILPLYSNTCFSWVDFMQKTKTCHSLYFSRMRRCEIIKNWFKIFKISL